MKAVVNRQQAAVVSTGGLFDNSLVARWIKFCGVGKNSVRTYKNALKVMFGYFAANNISTPCRSTLESWRDSLIAADKSASTIQLYIGVAKMFFRWTAFEGIFPNVADNLKCKVRPTSGHKKDALTKAQAQKLLKSISGNDEKSLRDKAIVGLLLSTGLRSCEVINANVGDLSYTDDGVFLHVKGKARHDRQDVVRVPQQVLTLIQNYLAARGGRLKANSPLFVSTSRRNAGQRLQTQTISRLVKKSMRGIGLNSPRYSCHSTRHTCATLMLLNGVQLADIQQILRHKSVSTTLLYIDAFKRAQNVGENVAASVVFDETAA